MTIDRAELYRQLGVDGVAAGRALDGGRDHGDDLPWYVMVMIGAGALLSAGFAIGLLAAVVFLLIDPDDPEYLLLAMGAVGYGLSVAAPQRYGPSLFLEQLAAVIGVASAVAMAVAVAFIGDDPWAVTIFLILLTGLNTVLPVSQLARFLVAAMAIGLLQVSLFEDRVAFTMEILILLTLLPGILLIRFPPPRFEVYPLAIAALFSLPAYDIFIWSWLLEHVTGAPQRWSPGVVVIAGVFLWLLWDGRRRHGGGRPSWGLAFVGLAGTLAILLLPPGGGSLVIVLVLAHGIGSWPLALGAGVLEVFFLWRFYYDLQMTLLTKSGILVAVGILLLIAWILVVRERRADSQTTGPAA